MVSMSSTLVETVSINYEDFNESFLTCGTCLCKFTPYFCLVKMFMLLSNVRNPEVCAYPN